MFIVDTLRAEIRRQHPNAVPAQLKVFATLQFLATGNFIGTSGDVIGASKAAAGGLWQLSPVVQKKFTR